MSQGSQTTGVRNPGTTAVTCPRRARWAVPFTRSGGEDAPISQNATGRPRVQRLSWHVKTSTCRLASHAGRGRRSGTGCSAGDDVAPAGDKDNSRSDDTPARPGEASTALPQQIPINLCSRSTRQPPLAAHDPARHTAPASRSRTRTYPKPGNPHRSSFTPTAKDPS